MDRKSVFGFANFQAYFSFQHYECVMNKISIGKYSNFAHGTSMNP